VDSLRVRNGDAFGSARRVLFLPLAAGKKPEHRDDDDAETGEHGI
jgi:hypothetical protein